jgi:hypothetical protein
VTGAVLLGGQGIADGATFTSYRGTFEPSGVVRFDLKKTANGKSVVNFKWARLPLDCENGPETTGSRLLFEVQVERRQFFASAVDDPDNPGARLELEGELVGTDRAKGTLRIRGRRVPVDQGPRQNCDSGVLSWSARTQPG